MRKISEAAKTIRALEFWPEDDRQAWIAACRPAERLKPGGAAAHLKQVTRDDLAQRYGYFLKFLERSELLSLRGPAAANVTLENIDSYIIDLKARVSSVTVYGSICKVRRTSQLICPARDFTWLYDIERDLALEMRPRSKFDRVVSANVLLEAGLTLIWEAEIATRLSNVERARQVRNGLMIALLALCPIRLKNFLALEIGSTFVQIEGQWWIVLAASQTKEKRADERPVDDILSSPMSRYLTLYRPTLARATSSSALWLSSNDGQPMRRSGIQQAIKSITLSTVGVGVSPHMFRDSAAAMNCGEHPFLGAAILHHRDPAVTERHYNRASSPSAGRKLRGVIRKL
jgi:integrase